MHGRKLTRSHGVLSTINYSRWSYRSCHLYYYFQCARLMVQSLLNFLKSHLIYIKVPLDLNYSEPDGANAIIALTRIPSSLPTSSPWYRGPILINPGGPGGSGIEAVMIVGGHLSAIVGPQFHLVGFDLKTWPNKHVSVRQYIITY